MNKKRRKRLRDRLVRVFTQKKLHGIAEIASKIGSYGPRGRPFEIGSSSIRDPFGHIAKVKMAMGIQPSSLDVFWAQAGDTDVSLYVGFQPGKHPNYVDPLVWLKSLADVLPNIERETTEFVDRIFSQFADFMDLSRQAKPFELSELLPPAGQTTVHKTVLPLAERTVH